MFGLDVYSALALSFLGSALFVVVSLFLVKLDEENDIIDLF